MSKSLPSAEDLANAMEVIEGFVGSFEPGQYSGEDAKKLVCIFSELEQVTTSLIVRAAKRVDG